MGVDMSVAVRKRDSRHQNIKRMWGLVNGWMVG